MQADRALKEAARDLKIKLSEFEWFVNIGTTNNVLYVYVQDRKHFADVETLLTNGQWNGFEIALMEWKE